MYTFAALENWGPTLQGFLIVCAGPGHSDGQKHNRTYYKAMSHRNLIERAHGYHNR